MVSPYGDFISYQANVDANGNNIVGDAANEPSIAVDPTDSNKMTIGWRQFDTWAGPTSGRAATALPPMAASPGRSPAFWRTTFSAAIPFWIRMSWERFSISALGTRFCDNIWRSTSGGQSWTNFVGTSGGDKQWFTIDKTDGPGHGFQYQFWTDFFPCTSGQFSRSTDGGMSWQPPIDIPHGVMHGTADVDTNGNLFIGGEDLLNVTFWCIRSSNAQFWRSDANL